MHVRGLCASGGIEGPLYEPFCVSNLLTQFQRSGARGRVSPLFPLLCSWAPLWSPSSCTPPRPSLANNTLPYLPSPSYPFLLLVLMSFILSSVCLHILALVSFSYCLLLLFIYFLRNFADAAFENMCFKGDVKGQLQAGEYCRETMGRKEGYEIEGPSVCFWGLVLGLIVGIEGHTVICVLSAALRLTQRDVFQPLSPICTKSRGGFYGGT